MVQFDKDRQDVMHVEITIDNSQLTILLEKL
jgi:hypothetical protein